MMDLAHLQVSLLVEGARLGLAQAESLDTWALIASASLVVKAVMLLLVAMSLFSWYIIFYKSRYLAAANNQSEEFREHFWGSSDIEEVYQHAKELDQSPESQMFRGGYNELARLQRQESWGKDADGDLESIERALMKAQLKATTRLESLTPFLATTGSAAPFIGLFGTVWGIMNSFKAIGAMKSASVQTVAPGIAEALIATAIGLLAAIPAVMAYNYFVRKIRLIEAEMENFSKDFLNTVRRNFLS